MAPNTALNVLPPAPNSGVFVLPTTIAPAVFNRSTTRASSFGTLFSKIFEPYVVRMSFVGVRSLIETGTPCSGGKATCVAIISVAASAAASADSRASVT